MLIIEAGLYQFRRRHHYFNRQKTQTACTQPNALDMNLGYRPKQLATMIVLIFYFLVWINRESGLHLGGGGGKAGRSTPPPPLRIATIHIHSIESSDTKSCQKQMFLLILTCKLLSASCSVWEGAYSPHASTPWYWILHKYCIVGNFRTVLIFVYFACMFCTRKFKKKTTKFEASNFCMNFGFDARGEGLIRAASILLNLWAAYPKTWSVVWSKQKLKR